jgi:hypothetical protein
METLVCVRLNYRAHGNEIPGTEPRNMKELRNGGYTNSDPEVYYCSCVGASSLIARSSAAVLMAEHTLSAGRHFWLLQPVAK